MRTFKLPISLVFTICGLIGCGERSNEELPILGRPDFVEARNADGSIRIDTIYHTIEEFAFVDQDSALVTNSTFDNSIYVSDFFFTSCPSICPIMKTQMLRVYEEFANVDQVKFLSHSIDPTHDTVAVLRDYAERLGVTSDKWHFVTGDKQAIYKTAQNSYLSVVGEESQAPGGYIHSGKFLLIDKKRQIRSVRDGTNEQDVDLLIAEIYKLLKEEQESGS